MSNKLGNFVDLSADELIAEVKKLRPRTPGLSVAAVKQLRDEYAKEVEPLRAMAREAAGLERRVSDVVNAAYGLTPAEVALLWQTAPPRMPITALQ